MRPEFVRLVPTGIHVHPCASRPDLFSGPRSPLSGRVYRVAPPKRFAARNRCGRFDCSNRKHVTTLGREFVIVSDGEYDENPPKRKSVATDDDVRRNPSGARRNRGRRSKRSAGRKNAPRRRFDQPSSPLPPPARWFEPRI